ADHRVEAADRRDTAGRDRRFDAGACTGRACGRRRFRGRRHRSRAPSATGGPCTGVGDCARAHTARLEGAYTRPRMMAYPSESATRAAVDEPRASAVLAIGRTASSGGAGLARVAGGHAECAVAAPIAVTAVTVQSDERVIDVLAMPARLVREQVRAAFATHDIRAVKIGMVGTRDVVEAIADTLPPRADVPIVLDPVLAASS